MRNNHGPLEVFAAKLKTKAFKVLNYPSYIFLCGGKLETPEGGTPSVRSLFYKQIEKSNPKILERVLLAEDANAWYQVTNVYKNLVELEEHLAGLSSFILLFVESAGSIAELGAFSFVQPLRKKLYAVIEEHYYRERSFIKEGPLTLLEQNNNDSVLAFPWGRLTGEKWVFDSDLCSETVKQIESHLRQKLTKRSGRTSFFPDDHGHRMLLIADLIGLAGAVQQVEILSLLRGLLLPSPEIDGTTLGQYLFLLGHLKLVHQTRYGNKNYFLSGEKAETFIDYQFLENEIILDRLRLSDNLKKSLPKDRDRTRVYKRSLESGGQK